MQLVFHTGAHFTEEERLMKCLLRNKEAFGARGISVPGPGKYRKLLMQTLSAMNTAPAANNAREVLLDAILDDERADRVLLSNAHFFGTTRAAVRDGILYPEAPERLSHIAKVFRGDEIELHMGIRNLATFLPSCFEKSPRETLADFFRGVDPREIRWSDTFLQMREAAPEIPITVWCNEDAPLVWTQVIREIAGLHHGEYIVGGHDLLSDIMSKDGMARFVSYLKSKPQMSEIQIRRAMAAFLQKYALDEAIEEEIDVQGWTEELVQELTESYEEDVLAIARIPGVQLISP